MVDDKTQTIEERDKELARAWKAKHQAHVLRLMKADQFAYAPSGSDVIHPELWKGAHWNWLESQT